MKHVSFGENELPAGGPTMQDLPRGATTAHRIKEIVLVRHSHAIHSHEPTLDHSQISPARVQILKIFPCVFFLLAARKPPRYAPWAYLVGLIFHKDKWHTNAMESLQCDCFLWSDTNILFGRLITFSIQRTPLEGNGKFRWVWEISCR